MSIEAHITVSHPPAVEPALHAWLAPRRLKLTRIELSHGACPRQTMITAWQEGQPGDAIREAHAIRDALAPLGVAVSRIKLEVAHAPGAAPLPALYAEHHVKVRAPRDRVASLAALGAACGAHLSRNPRRALDGVEERFLTQRFPPEAHLAAETGLASLLDALRAASVTIAKIERERVIHDDNLSLDAGWRPEISP